MHVLSQNNKTYKNIILRHDTCLDLNDYFPLNSVLQSVTRILGSNTYYV